jgi:putative sterol carrier protein
MLTAFVKGMTEAGTEVEVINLKHKKINYCVGCYNCWTKTPGICAQKDDMTAELFPKFIGADIVVLASPLFHYTVNAQMKAFIERTLPILQPYLKPMGKATGHPLRQKHPSIVLISVAGFPEMSVFEALSFWANKVYGRGTGLLAEIYRPAAEAMVYSGKRKVILEAVEKAGREIVTDRKVSKETMDSITQPILSTEMMAAMSNLSWQSMIDKNVTMAEASRQRSPIRPNSVETLMAMLAFAFNPEKAGGKSGTLQFNLSGEHAGACYFMIKDGDISAFQGKADKANCVVDTPFEVWADIIEGKADGAKMMLDGKYKASGDIALMMVFGE